MSIALVMIVKNEALTIERCIDSVRDHIDYWVICDTGSTDGTQEVIREALKDIPGELHEHEWVNFGHNRSLSLELARGKADYILVLDADFVLMVEPGALDNLTEDSYWIHHDGPMEIIHKILVSDRFKWRCEGAIHEYMTCDQAHGEEHLHGVKVHHYADGGSRANRQEQDLELLKEAIEKDPNDTRSMFYLAQTYRDTNQPVKALEHYLARAKMVGWVEENYRALLEAGRLLNRLGNRAAANVVFTDAWQRCPHRLEAVYELTANLRNAKKFHPAHQLAKIALEYRECPEGGLFNEPWVYDWGLLFELSITSYWVGDYSGSVELCNELLAKDSLPNVHRVQVIKNLGYATERCIPA